MQTRKIIRNVVAVILFSFLIIAFAVTGVTSDVFRPVAKDTVVSAGRHEVSGRQFKTIFDRERERAGEQMGRPLTVAEAVEQRIDQAILQEMLGETVRQALMDKLGLRPSVKLVAEELRKIPAFFDPVSGRFDAGAYQTTIAESLGVTDTQFEKMLGTEIAASHFASGLQAGVRAPLAYGALQGAAFLEKRDASVIFVSPQSVGAVPAPTEEQLRGFMQENASRLMMPERREISFVRLSRAKAMETATANPAALQQMVEARRTATPERRTVVQIPAKDRAAAQSIAQRLRGGEDPAAVAQAVGASVVRYEQKTKGEIPDRRIAEAAFATAKGQVSGPVEGDLGLAVVQVLEVSDAPSVDAIRAQTEQELRQRAAELKVTEAADKLEEALASGGDLEAAARAVGVEVVKTPAIAQNGTPDRGPPPAGLSRKLLETAFQLPAGEVSEFETEEAGEYFIVRVDKVHEPALAPFEEVRSELDRAWRARELDRRLNARGEEIARRLRAGEAVEAVASSVGGQARRITDLDQGSAQAMAQEYGPQLLGAVLQAKKGDVRVASAGQQGLNVFRVDAVRPGDPNEIARGVVGARGQFSQQIAELMFDSIGRYARDAVGAKTYPDRARQVIGAEPIATDKGAAQKEKDKG